MKYVIRNSDRRSFKACRRAWGWGSPLRGNLVSKVTPKPLEFGTAYHAAMAVYYDPDTWHLLKSHATAQIVQQRALDAFIAATKAQRQKYESLAGELFLELEEDFDARLELGIGMLKHYFVYAPTVDKFTPIKAEIEFEVPIPGMSEVFRSNEVVYRGRLDTIVQDEQGWYWNLEHKTTGTFGDSSHLDLDEQITSYGWALSQMGIRLKGAIYSESLKKVPEPPKRLVNQREGRWFSVNKMQSTTYELVMEEIVKAGEDPDRYMEFLQYLLAEGNHYFRRYQQHRSTAEYNDMGVRLAQEAEDMIDCCQYYPNPGRFNCNFCRFREPCLALNRDMDWEFMLREGFITREEDEALLAEAAIIEGDL